MSNSIAEKAAIFTKELEETSSYSEARDLCIAVRDSLRKQFKTNTLATYLTTYRKAVKATFKPQKANRLLGHLKLTGREKGKRASSYSKKLSKQQKKLKQIDSNKLISLAIELVTQPEIEGKTFARGKRAGQSVPKSYYKLTLGLMLLTGRRPTEVLKTAKFRANKGRKYEVRVSGLIKGDFDHENKVFEIPTLAESKLIREAVGELRKLKDLSGETRKRVNSITSKDLGLYCKKLFGGLLGEEVKPYALRSAYAAICLSKHKAGWESANAYLAKIMGHDEDDVQTASSYQIYYI